MNLRGLSPDYDDSKTVNITVGNKISVPSGSEHIYRRESLQIPDGIGDTNGN
jgi:hypothetical protein